MKLHATLGVDVVAVESDEQLAVLLELTAPSAPTTSAPRAPSTLVVVLDRSGSMAGDRLEGAKRALTSLVDRLDPADCFGLVSFDDQVRVEVSAGPTTDKSAIKTRIAAIDAGSCTDLSSGYLRGLQEAQRVAGDAGGSVLLISDGHANAGMTEPDQLGSVAATYARRGISTSALGFGLGYDERLLSATARGGRGNELFAEDADRATALITGEVEELLNQSVQAASLLVRMSSHVRGVRLANELPASMVAGGLLVELGGFYADEQRKLLISFDIPAMTRLGHADIATLELRYVDVTTLKEKTVTILLRVNVVPGDEAARRVANPVVVTELAFQTAQRAKRQASHRLSAGDGTGAVGDLRTASAALADAMACASPEAADGLSAEAAVLDEMLAEVAHGGHSRAAKLLSVDTSLKSRHRGRRQK